MTGFSRRRVGFGFHAFSLEGNDVSQLSDFRMRKLVHSTEEDSSPILRQRTTPTARRSHSFGEHMNKSLVLLALPAFLLAGCSSEPTTAEPVASAAPVVATASPSATLKPTPKPTKTATGEEQVKEIYLESLYKSEPGLRAAGAGDDLVSIGQGFCDMYDGGAKGSDINAFILKGAGWAYTVRQLVAVHGSAVGAFCPEHIDKMGL